MTENKTYYSESMSAYPGKYEPMPWKEQEFINELNENINAVIEPKVQVNETPGTYSIELPAPGFQREDFFVHAKDRYLSIAAINRADKNENRSSGPDRIRYKYIFLKIDLPFGVDTEFGSAEYRNGKLTVHLQKTRHTIDKSYTHIIVY
jgi:HSP20 family protein